MMARVRFVAMFACVTALLGACGRAASRAETDESAGSGTAAGRAIVVDVTDGDTIRVRVGGQVESIRLIGIDTPETHGHGGLVECFGQEASRRTAELLPEGAAVRLERDVEARDRYGRLLAYVHTSDGTFVNLALAREGFAAPLTIPPNVAYGDAFATAAAQARQANVGLWGQCGGADTPLRRITAQGAGRTPVPSHP